MVVQQLHGCRQLVPWGVPLSGRTSATRVQCYMFHWRPPALKVEDFEITINENNENDKVTHNEFIIVIFVDLLFCYFRSLKSVVAFESGRKERTTSSQHGAYNLGNTHPTMANNNGMQGSNAKQIPTKFRLSSD